jgi:hypothetical protein
MLNTKVTGDTITDEQLRAQLDRAEIDLVYENRWWKDNKHLSNNSRAHDEAVRSLREIIEVCKSALNPQCHATRRIEARARCAVILNMRTT